VAIFAGRHPSPRNPTEGRRCSNGKHGRYEADGNGQGCQRHGAVQGASAAAESNAEEQVALHLGAAIHEAGHAIAAEVLGLRVAVLSVESNGDGLCLLELPPHAAAEAPAAPEPSLSAEQIHALIAHAATLPNPLALIADSLQGLYTDAKLRDYLVQSMAGRVAQARVGPEALAVAGADGDRRNERLLIFMLSERTNVELTLADCRSIACDLVSRHWPAITVLAAVLMARRKLSGDEVRQILRKQGAPEATDSTPTTGVVGGSS
jgi:hypothetical protein